MGRLNANLSDDQPEHAGDQRGASPLNVATDSPAVARTGQDYEVEAVLAGEGLTGPAYFDLVLA